MSVAARTVLISSGFLRRVGRRVKENVFVMTQRGSSSLALEKASNEKAETWRIMSSVCVERWPVITQEKTEMEAKFAKLIEELEFENSRLSDHEKRHQADLKLEARRKQDDFDGDVDSSSQTAIDMEDIWEAEAREFTPAARLTDADRANDLKSVERKLDEKLVLLVRQKLGDTHHWVFPQGEWVEGESMRETAERVLTHNCGDGLSAQFLGHAPCGLHQYRFKSNLALGTGAKVFFFKASYKAGVVQMNKDTLDDYVWVTKSELKHYVRKSYFRSINPFILNL